VFDGTIRENLTYAVSDDIKESKVTDAVQLANCDFIYDLPD
jgi:ABC-type multidrug transport system fused ATPase/permease subunit